MACPKPLNSLFPPNLHVSLYDVTKEITYSFVWGGCDFYTTFLGSPWPVLLEECSMDQHHQYHQGLVKNANFQDPTSDLLNQNGSGARISISTTPPGDLYAHLNLRSTIKVHRHDYLTT